MTFNEKLAKKLKLFPNPIAKDFFEGGALWAANEMRAEVEAEKEEVNKYIRLREALIFIHDECLKRPIDVRAIIKIIKEAEK